MPVGDFDDTVTDFRLSSCTYGAAAPSLLQMDGIHGKLEAVLTIGATNMAADLDGALVRPGRFEVSRRFSLNASFERLGTYRKRIIMSRLCFLPIRQRPVAH